MYLSQTRGRTARPDNLDAEMEGFTPFYPPTPFYLWKKTNKKQKHKYFPIFHDLAH